MLNAECRGAKRRPWFVILYDPMKLRIATLLLMTLSLTTKGLILSISAPSITTLDDAECHYVECYCALVVLAAEIFVCLFLLFISIRK